MERVYTCYKCGVGGWTIDQGLFVCRDTISCSFACHNCIRKIINKLDEEIKIYKKKLEKYDKDPCSLCGH
jgi:hypothetical protein